MNGMLSRMSDRSFWDQALRDRLRSDLQAQYEQSMKEPLPERFADLLEQLEQQEQVRGSKRDHERN